MTAIERSDEAPVHSFHTLLVLPRRGGGHAPALASAGAQVEAKAETSRCPSTMGTSSVSPWRNRLSPWRSMGTSGRFSRVITRNACPPSFRGSGTGGTTVSGSEASPLLVALSCIRATTNHRVDLVRRAATHSPHREQGALQPTPRNEPSGRLQRGRYFKFPNGARGG